MREQETFDFEGLRLRDAGVSRVVSNNAAWSALALDEIRFLAATRDEFTSDDLRELITAEPKHLNAWGAAFCVADKKGIIEACGVRRSLRPKAHGRKLTVWRRVAS